MPAVEDGPSSSLFKPIALEGNIDLAAIADADISEAMKAAARHAPTGRCVCWGIPFQIARAVALTTEPITVHTEPFAAKWLVFMHTSDLKPAELNSDGLISPMRGEGRLAEHAANYTVLYADGTEEALPIRRRFQIGAFKWRWGETCFEAVIHHKNYPVRHSPEHPSPHWGTSQTRVKSMHGWPWTNWLWAWENPHDDAIVGFRFEMVGGGGTVVISAVSGGNPTSLPLRWRPRRKALLTLSPGESFDPHLDEHGQLKQIRLDLGQVISATPRRLYPDEDWANTYSCQAPDVSQSQMVVEYTSHPDARFHLSSGKLIPVAQVEAGQAAATLGIVPPADQRVRLRVIEKSSGKLVAVRLHIHGVWGEYLPPVDRHRIINPDFFEDYSVDFIHENAHNCAYIPGETVLKLPLGRVYVEVSKGFEIQPIRKVIEVTPATEEITIELEKVLRWREGGWITADTHVHFLSPISALLEGEAEGVNVVNLLASQWGELMTNVGDFDGRSTWGSREMGGSGEYLVRVGTENRQNVIGHISLLGYQGDIITPLTTGGPDESALGDPVEVLLTDWARQCKQQGGLVVMPHFPDPRAENAACIVSGDIDAVEMTSWENLYGGIDPYSLSDWYRFLNCGYLTAAVGGTDKMRAATPVGAVRTYARLSPDAAFNYEAWMDAVRRAETFVTYGPLLEFFVDGQPMGSRIMMPVQGGTVDVTWQVASVTLPMSRVELVINGEIRESLGISPDNAAGSWTVKIDQSSWLALLVRGSYPNKPEIIAAHSSPIMVMVDGTELLAAADAVTILEQIEGALAYLDTVGTRAKDITYKRMRLTLVAAHRSLHNRMHQLGHYHEHTPLADHD